MGTIQRRVRLPIDIGAELKIKVIRLNQKGSKKTTVRDYIVADLLRVNNSIPEKPIDLSEGTLCQLEIPTAINDRLRDSAEKLNTTIEEYTVRLIYTNLKNK